MTALRLVTDDPEPLTREALHVALDGMRRHDPDLAGRSDAELLARPAGDMAERLREAHAVSLAASRGLEVHGHALRTVLGTIVEPDIEPAPDPLLDRVVRLPLKLELPSYAVTFQVQAILSEAIGAGIAMLDDDERARLAAWLDEHEHDCEAEDCMPSPAIEVWVRQDGLAVWVGSASTTASRSETPSSPLLARSGTRSRAL